MKKRTKILTTIRNYMAGAALLCVMLAAGTSDYHVMELGAEPPATVSRLLWTAALLILPTVIYLIREYVKERTK